MGGVWLGWARAVGLLALALLVVVWVAPVHASEWAQTRVRRTAEGVAVTASVDVRLSPTMEDALRRAVPFYFVFQAEVLRERWYWADKRVASATRTVRLAHQPLTRQWRVSWSFGPTPGAPQAYALHQNHATLTQALAAVSGVSNWLVAEASRLEPGARHVLNLRFKLDLALLPRPFQLGMNAQDEWAIDLAREWVVPPQVGGEVAWPGVPPGIAPPANPGGPSHGASNTVPGAAVGTPPAAASESDAPTDTGASTPPRSP